LGPALMVMVSGGAGRTNQ